MRSTVVVALCALLLAGCSDSRDVRMRVVGVKPLNLNEAQESTPVNVRIFALKTDAKFRAATVDQLWTDAKAVLGEDLAGDPAVITVFPGEAADEPVVHQITVKKSANHIGVLAMYQRSDAQDLRTAVVPVKALGETTFLFTGFAVRLEDEAAAKARQQSAPGGK